MIPEKEAIILHILIKALGGRTFGLDIVSMSNGALKRGTVYITLDRMEQKGLIKSSKDGKVIGHTGLQKRIYWTQRKGRNALQEYRDKILSRFGTD